MIDFFLNNESVLNATCMFFMVFSMGFSDGKACSKLFVAVNSMVFLITFSLLTLSVFINGVEKGF